MQRRGAVNLRRIDIRLLLQQRTHRVLIFIHHRICYVTARRSETLRGQEQGQYVTAADYACDCHFRCLPTVYLRTRIF